MSDDSMVNHGETADLATIPPPPPPPLNPGSIWTLLHPPPPLQLTLTIGCTLTASAACHFTGSLIDKHTHQDVHEYTAQPHREKAVTYTANLFSAEASEFTFLKLTNYITKAKISKMTLVCVCRFFYGAQKRGVISIHLSPWNPADNPSPFSDYVR